MDLFMKLKVPNGVSNFKKLRLRNGYYVDKTSYFKVLLDSIEKGLCQVQLFTRPRRFGKSLFLSSLEAFLSPNYQNPEDLSSHLELFKDTAVLKETEFCQEFMGKYPTVLISFKETESKLNTYEDSCFQVALKVKEAVEKLKFIKSFKLDESEQKKYKAIVALDKNNFSIEEFPTALNDICKIINDHFGVMPIVLIDEYDVPLAKCYREDYYDNFRKFFASLLGNALKDGDFVTKAFITGCLKISKESIFTGFNNFTVSSLSNGDVPDLCGFTEQEVDDLLSYYDLTDKKDIFKHWYDGYRIGNKDIYCPWDVLNYISDLIVDNTKEPWPYWKNSGSFDILRDIYDKAPHEFSEDIAKLVNHETICKKIDESISFNDVNEKYNPNYFWTMLYSTGYLTLVNSYKHSKEIELKIPNACVYDTFKDLETWTFSKGNVSYSNTRTKLLDALFDGNDSVCRKILSNTLIVATSYKEFGRNVDKEAYYQSFLNGMFVDYANNDIYTYDPSYETGFGCADVVITKNNQQSVILELKVCKSREKLEETALVGLNQIFDKKYDEGVFARKIKVQSIICAGLSFCGKDCYLVFKEVKRES